MSQRTVHAGFVATLLALWLVSCLASCLVGCNAFDRGHLLPAPGGMGGGGMGGVPDAGDDPDGSVCTPSAELCNGADEDCDGIEDVDDPDALATCEEIVVHARAGCGSTMTRNGPLVLCVRVACDPGWSSCDGSPSNGCEYQGDTCPVCVTCEDAGGEDSGSSAAE